jgi:hypothetical protein
VSVDRTALQWALAGRYRLSETWRIGAGVEANPWWSLESTRFRPGSLNIYATVIRRFPINDWAAVRTSGHLGTSVLLFGLSGAPAGSLGLYAAITVLGLEVRLSEKWLLVVDPCEVSVPVPHLTGAPVAYRQYRLTIGVQFGG